MSAQHGGPVAYGFGMRRSTSRDGVKGTHRSWLPQGKRDPSANDPTMIPFNRAGPTMSLEPAAMVVLVYVIVNRANVWLPFHGIALRADGFVTLCTSMVLVAVRVSERPLLRSASLTGWVNWSFALGFVPLTALVAGVLTEAAVSNVFTVGPPGTYNDLPPVASTSDRWLLWLVAVVGAVIVEELLYRGAMLSIFLNVTRSPAIAVLIPSVTWGLVHGGVVGGYNAAQVSGIAASGLVAGWACYRTRSLIPGVAAHLLHNLLAGGRDAQPWTIGFAVIGFTTAFTMAIVFIVVQWRSGRAMRDLHQAEIL